MMKQVVAGKILVVLVCAVFLVSGSALASEGHYDALVFQDGGQVQMGSIDVECLSGLGEPGCDPDGNTDNVYEAELEETGTSPGLVGSAEEPGFFAVPDTAGGNLPYGQVLPGTSTHSFDITLAPNSPVSGASILFWDGSGPVTWSSVPNSEYFEVEGNAGTGGTLTGSSTLSGIGLDPTSASGSFDTHPDFLLYGSGGTVDPTAGFYTLFGITQIQGLSPSDPWGVVFDFGIEDEELHEAAVGNVYGFIPEPATGILLTSGLLGLALHRRGGKTA